MNSEPVSQEHEVESMEQKPGVLNSVTPLSKYLAMILFITMPFLGGWIGYKYSPEKVVEIEIVQEKDIQTSVSTSSAETDFLPEIKNADSMLQNKGDIDSYKIINPVVFDDLNYFQISRENVRSRIVIQSTYSNNLVIKQIINSPKDISGSGLAYLYYDKTNDFYLIESNNEFRSILRIGSRNLHIENADHSVIYEPLSNKFYLIDRYTKELSIIEPEILSTNVNKIPIFHFEDPGDAGHGRDTYFIVYKNIGIELVVLHSPGGSDFEQRQNKFLEEIDSIITNLNISEIPYKG